MSKLAQSAQSVLFFLELKFLSTLKIIFLIICEEIGQILLF